MSEAEVLLEQCFYVIKTSEGGIGYEDFMAFDDYLRNWWVDRCNRYNEEMQDAIEGKESIDKAGPGMKEI